jgi:hypothetical protein
VSGLNAHEIPVNSVRQYYDIEMQMMESSHTDIYEQVFDIVIENKIQNVKFDIYAAVGGQHKKFSVIHYVFIAASST